jgi:flagellar motility protein MotE (MotC chaperone)
LGNRRKEVIELQKALESAEDRMFRGKLDEAKFERFEKIYNADIDVALRDIAEIEASIKVLHTAKTDTDRLKALQAFKDSFNGENVTD